jgi:c-di-GMP-binding flagellar brake protein YcgR
MPRKKGTPRVERRQSTRADASLSMRVEGYPDDGELTQIVTESQNISASGVYCSSPHYLAPLSKVALTIVLPNQKSTQGTQRLLKCEGIVVRCQVAGPPAKPSGYDLACSFIGLEPRHRVLLDDFVTWRNLQALRAVAPRKRKAAARAKSAPRRVAARKTAARSAARRAISR